LESFEIIWNLRFERFGVFLTTVAGILRWEFRGEQCESQELMALADSDRASRTPGFVDVVQRCQFAESA
jgi:hypothetical protein